MHRPTLRLSGRLHPLAWLFIALAVADVIWYVLNASFAPADGLAERLAYAIQIVPSVAVFLMPAALLTRHPDAHVAGPDPSARARSWWPSARPC